MKDKIYQFQIANLNKRIEKSKVIINNFLNFIQKPYIALSWGKDSTTMMHLILTINPKIDVIFWNSNDCLSKKANQPIRDEYLKLYKIINYYEIEKSSPFDKYKKFGIPGIDISFKEYKAKASIEAKKRINTLNNIYDGVFLGLRMNENEDRRINILKRGDTYYNKEKQIYVCNPIAYWQYEDIWTYIKINNLPYCSNYDNDMIFNKKELRNEFIFFNNYKRGALVNLKLYERELYNEVEIILENIINENNNNENKN